MNQKQTQDHKFQVLTEAIGKCYHDWHVPPTNSLSPYQCTKCGLKVPNIRDTEIDFNDWTGFGLLLAWCRSQYKFHGLLNDITLLELSTKEFSDRVYRIVLEERIYASNRE
jgi:hypothetical protein